MRNSIYVESPQVIVTTHSFLYLEIKIAIATMTAVTPMVTSQRLILKAITAYGKSNLWKKRITIFLLRCYGIPKIFPCQQFSM